MLHWQVDFLLRVPPGKPLTHYLPARVSKHFSGCGPSTHIFPAHPISLFCPRRIADCWLTAFQDTLNTLYGDDPPEVSTRAAHPSNHCDWCLSWGNFQVTLVVNFAGLLDCSAVSNLLTSIFILRSFLMSLQISPAARILWLRWLFPFESIFWMDLICVVSALCSLQRKEKIIWCHFSAKFSRKSKENIGSFPSPLSPPPYIFHFQPKVYSQGFILSVVPVCPLVHQLLSFRELVCSITLGYMFPQAKHFAVFLFGKS